MQTYSEQMLLERIVRLEKEREKDRQLIDYLYDRAERTDWIVQGFIEGSISK